MSEPYETQWAIQVVPYGPYGPPEVLIFAQKNSGKFEFLILLGTKMPISRALLGPNGANFDTRTVGVSENF